MLRLLWLCLVCCLFPGFVGAEEELYVVGVLAARPKPQTQAQWQPLANYLASEIKGARFRVEALDYPELEARIADGSVAFVFTNPSHYVLVKHERALSAPLVSLQLDAGGKAVAHYGGVVFALAGRGDIKELADLRGRRVATPTRGSFGGYQIQAYELLQAGLRAGDDFAVDETGMPHDRVVDAVLSGAADVGFVRAGLLEEMSREGRLDPTRLKIINAQSLPKFPHAVSTRLYPQWALAAMPQVDQEVAGLVAAALLRLPHAGTLAQRMGIHGFSIPMDYEPARLLLQSLRLPPYDRLPEFTVGDVWQRFRGGIVGLLALATMVSLLAFGLFVSTRRLRHESEARHRLLAGLGEGVYGVDSIGRCSFINPAALAMLQFSEGEVLGQNQHALFHHHRPNGSVYPGEECPIHLTLLDGVTRRGEEWFWRRDGSGFPVSVTVTLVSPERPESGAVVVFRDLTEAKAVEASNQMLRAALQAAPTGIMITDREANIEWVNPAFVELTGYGVDEVLGHQPAELQKSGLQAKDFYEAMWRRINSGQVWRGEIINRRKNGQLYPEYLTIAPVLGEGGEVAHFVGIKVDISAQKRLEEELRQLASTDALTGLLNRRAFMQRLEQEWARCRRFPDTVVALLMFDLDHFKAINDSLGHASGDLVLRHFAGELQGGLRSTDLAGRLGGEEFAVLLPGADLTAAVAWAERLRTRLAQVPVPATLPTAYTTSAGVTLLSSLDSSPEAALARADNGLYRAKSEGRNRTAMESVAGSL